MKIKRGLKTVGSFVMDVLKVVSPVVVTGMMLNEPSKYRTIIRYSDALKAINNSGMWSDDKVKVITVLPVDMYSDFYKAVIEVINSSMWSEDKAKVIIEMCKKVGS